VLPERRDRHWPAEASAARRAFSRRLRAIVADGVDCASPVGFQVVCFSSQADLPEQVASLRSFLTYAGVPERLTIVSDGTHSPSSRRLLRALHPSIDVRGWRSLVRSDLPEALLTYSRTGW
jgi:hypothetical protein